MLYKPLEIIKPKKKDGVTFNNKKDIPLDHELPGTIPLKIFMINFSAICIDLYHN